MTRRITGLLILVLVLLPAGKVVCAQPLVTGYHAWWMQDSWRDYDMALYDKLFFFEFAVESGGRITETHGWPGRWRPFIDAVHAAGSRVAPTFAILDPQVYKEVLGVPEARNRLKSTVTEMVRSAGADGAHLNFETFEAATPEARAGFVRLVRELREALTAYKADAELTVFLPGFDHGEAYDEASLAAASDYVVVQGYDMHWLTAPTAGPVAPVRGWGGASWEGILARYRALGIPENKIVMAVPYFGYEWPTLTGEPGSPTRGEGQPITFAPVDPELLPLIRISATERAARYGTERDVVSDSPFFRYRATDGWRQGWYEDAASLRAKYRFTKSQGLGGVAVFLLGYDGGRLEHALRSEFSR